LSRGVLNGIPRHCVFPGSPQRGGRPKDSDRERFEVLNYGCEMELVAMRVVSRNTVRIGHDVPWTRREALSEGRMREICMSGTNPQRSGFCLRDFDRGLRWRLFPSANSCQIEQA
jgi:hypothetical protein